jgi:hypothetical protein
MPFTYVLDAATDIVRTTAHGLIRFDDLAAHLQALVDAGVGRVPQLIDARDAQHDLSVTDIRCLVELVSHLPAAHGFSHRTALVVSTRVDFGMARMYGLPRSRGSGGLAARRGRCWLCWLAFDLTFRPPRPEDFEARFYL